MAAAVWGAVDDHDDSRGAAPQTGPAPGVVGDATVLALLRSATDGEIDLRRVATGVRHLVASAEPARVFSQLASICVPGVADSCVIELSERGGHRYRIRQPADDLGTTGPVVPAATHARPDHAVASVGPDSVTVEFASTDDGCQSYTGVLTCRWLDGYQPGEGDAALVALLVDHATALVERERLATRVADLQDAAGQAISLPTHQRIAAAVGILMALHHLTAAQAADLLTRASQHTNQSIRGVADTVLRTGAMPEHAHHPTTSESHRVETPAERGAV